MNDDDTGDYPTPLMLEARRELSALETKLIKQESLLREAEVVENETRAIYYKMVDRYLHLYAVSGYFGTPRFKR